jgi:hypothetical protein
MSLWSHAIVVKGVPVTKPPKEETVPATRETQPRRRRVATKPPEAPPPAKNSVYAVSAAWDRVAPIAQEFEVEGEPPVKGDHRTPGRKRKDKRKRRRQAMSVSVSEEEESILRSYAADNHMSFSEWARYTLFQGMGQTIPERE